MIVRRIKSTNDTYNYYLDDGQTEISILFCDNGDLYFCSFSSNKESELYITKENMVIYNLFSDLFEAFANAEVFKVSEYDLLHGANEEELYQQVEKRNKELKESSIYNQVFHDNIITWISDDSLSFDYKSAEAMQIIKMDDCFKIKFTFYGDDYPYVRSIRIRNARSRYKPFNMIMMDLYNSLQEYDPNYHQVHIEEWLYEFEKTRKLNKRR